MNSFTQATKRWGGWVWKIAKKLKGPHNTGGRKGVRSVKVTRSQKKIWA